MSENGRYLGMRLSGEFTHSIDIKGRVTIPARFREELGEQFVITKGTDHCLLVFSLEMWNAFEEELQSLPRNRAARDYLRHMIGSAEILEPDKMGRCLISQALRSYAGLEKEVVLTGVLDRIEVWDKENWDRRMEEVSEHIDEIGESLAESGFHI